MDQTKPVKPTNRRLSQRRRARSAVRVECRKGSVGLGANIAVSVLDVSDTGARLILMQPLDVQQEVETIISAYGMRAPLKRLANVRWQVKMENGQYCTGIEFQKRLVYRDWQNLASPN